MIDTQELSLSASDGKRLALYRWAPEAEARGVVQIAHGMAEHGARYARLGQALAAQGYLVYASDHRGHGKTAASDDELGLFADADGWSRVIEDVHEINRHLASEHPELPRCLLGHSMGSFISAAYLQTHPGTVEAAVLSGTGNAGTLLHEAGRLIAKLERLRQGPRGRSALIAFMSFGAFNNEFKPARTEFDWLSRDPAEVDAYVADPRCGFDCTNSLWVDFLGGLVDIGRPERLARIPKQLPIYVFSGARDPVGEQGKGVEALVAKLRGAGLERVSLRLYADGRHEMINETNRDEVTADLIAWLGASWV